MKSLRKLTLRSFALIAVMLLSAFAFTLSARDYYQIKVYNLKDKAQEVVVDNYLKEAYLPALHKAGIKKVGVFKPIESDTANFGKKIFVLISLKELDQIEDIEKSLAGNKEYQKAGAAYINAPFDNPPYIRIESILLKAFADYPEMVTYKYPTPKSEQIFELRSYQGATEKIWRKKVEMFNEGGEIGIFKTVGSNAVFYGEVLSGSAMPNLMYLTSYENMDSNKKHWDAFRDNPKWKELSGMEEYKNTVSHIDKYMLHPAEYSDI